MSARDAARVGIRLLALFVAVRSLDAWGQLLALALPGLPWEQIDRTSVALAAAIPGAAQGIVALALWTFAGRLAARVAGRRDEPGRTAAEQAPETWAWTSAAIAAAGLVVAATAVPGLAGAVYLLSRASEPGFPINPFELERARAELIADVVRLLVGACLAFGAAPAAKVLGKLRVGVFR